MASKQTAFTVYTFDANGQITEVEDPKVIERMQQLSRVLQRQGQECGGVITTYLYRRETRQRTE